MNRPKKLRKWKEKKKKRPEKYSNPSFLHILIPQTGSRKRIKRSIEGPDPIGQAQKGPGKKRRRGIHKIPEALPGKKNSLQKLR